VIRRSTAAGLAAALVLSAFLAACIAGPGQSAAPSASPTTADLTSCEATAPLNPKDPELDRVFEKLMVELSRPDIRPQLRLPERAVRGD